MRAKDAFALEPDLLGDALGRDVVRIGDEIETLELEVVERVTREQAQRSRADSPTARRRPRSSSPSVRAVVVRS